VLKDVESPSMRKVCLAQLSFDLIVLSKKCTESLVGKERTSMESRKLLEFAFRNNLLTVARGIGDADALHAVISEGIDFVNGDFIAPKQEEVEAAIGIEDGVAGGYSGVAPLSEARHASAATSETWGEGVCRTASGVEKFGCSYSIGPRQLPTSGLRPLRHPVFSRFRRQNPRPKRLQSAGRPRHPGPGDFD
jgi:EAL domain-containing protein (putative c-di-GMP-specific phosphodiesterase class I)